jgi:uncharacterized protein YuzE
MAKELKLDYDEEGDILEGYLEENVVAISLDAGDDIWLRVDVRTGALVGFTILDFKRRKQPVKIPVTIQPIQSASFLIPAPDQVPLLMGTS